MENNLNFLSTRSGFNTALQHFKLVTGYIGAFQKGNNLADLINHGLENKRLQQYQISAILGALLIDKYNYYSRSFSIKTTIQDNLLRFADIFSKWKAFDLVFSYYHPQLGQIVINPKNKSSWEAIDCLKETELLVVYAGSFNSEFDLEAAKKCSVAVEKMLHGEKISDEDLFQEASVPSSKPKAEPKVEVKKTSPVKQTAAAPAPASAPQVKPVPATPAASGKKKMSPQYGVLVSNELFHNGNVEAWKKIIVSYENKYQGTQVLVFYEGEQIHDINTLFKWGKVKHGTNIYFSLLGTEFLDTSKLRRYLAQGASPRFEDFLKGDPTKALLLF